MHLTKIAAIIVLIALSSLTSCLPEGYNYESGSLPATPVNLAAFNTAYDDYNSTAPSMGRLIPFCFSSNRNSNGNDFDIIYRPMNVNFDKTSGILEVTDEYSNWSTFRADYDVIINGLSKVNTTGNEFGPCLIHHQDNPNSNSDFLLLYATDLSGNFDIHYTFNLGNPGFSEDSAVKFLNTEFNDLYPAFNHDFSKIYFCSDRENGNFDIFSVQIGNDYNSDNQIINELADSTFHQVRRDSVLSGNYNDKCPFIFDNFLIFASDRPGGFGGFDLYYSGFENGKWSTPVNFGSEINTEYDEYRPILFEESVDNDKNMMVFSSDRTGGKGGFDLYFVGISNQIWQSSLQRNDDH